jgi:hypothetical protein
MLSDRSRLCRFRFQNQYFSSLVSGEEVLVVDAPGSSAPVRGTSTPLRGKIQMQLADENISNFSFFLI